MKGSGYNNMESAKDVKRPKQEFIGELSCIKCNRREFRIWSNWTGRVRCECVKCGEIQDLVLAARFEMEDGKSDDTRHK